MSHVSHFRFHCKDNGDEGPECPPGIRLSRSSFMVFGVVKDHNNDLCPHEGDQKQCTLSPGAFLVESYFLVLVAMLDFGGVLVPSVVVLLRDNVTHCVFIYQNCEVTNKK